MRNYIIAFALVFSVLIFSPPTASAQDYDQYWQQPEKMSAQEEENQDQAYRYYMQQAQPAYKQGQPYPNPYYRQPVQQQQQSHDDFYALIYQY